jgi:hypothetical protein
MTADTGARPHPTAGEEVILPNIARNGDVVLSYREPMVEVRRGSRTVLSRRLFGWSAAAPGRSRQKRLRVVVVQRVRRRLLVAIPTRIDTHMRVVTEKPPVLVAALEVILVPRVLHLVVALPD